MVRGSGWYFEGGIWRKRYQNEDAKRAEFRGYSDKTMSKKAFERRLDEVAEIKFRRLTGKAVNDTRDISQPMKEYLAWGIREGGKGGRPWSNGQKANVKRYLPQVLKTIGARRLDGITLAAFERAIAPWENPRTRFIVGSIPKAFLNWCKARKMLAESPPADWPGRKMESDRKRRAPCWRRSNQLHSDFCLHPFPWPPSGRDLDRERRIQHRGLVCRDFARPGHASWLALSGAAQVFPRTST